LKSSAGRCATRAQIAVLLLWCGWPSPARADDTGISNAVPYVIAGAIGAAFDIGFTVYDATHLATGSTVPKSLGWIEMAGALPQVVIAGYILANPPPADGVRPLALAWGAWASLLAGHGIWTIVRPAATGTDPSSSAIPKEAPHRAVDPSRASRSTSRLASIWSVTWQF